MNIKNAVLLNNPALHPFLVPKRTLVSRFKFKFKIYKVAATLALLFIVKSTIYRKCKC